jgi:Tfp pilus assembly protein PilO
MRSSFRLQKRLIAAAVGLLIAADIALAVYSWQLGSSPHSQERDLTAQTRQLKILQADVERAKGIQSRMPTIQADCDRFEHALFPASTGYSSVTSDLDEIARKAGAQMLDLSFKQAEVSDRGLTAVDVTSIISGNYASIVHFVNGLQRSRNVYILDSLSLGGDTQNFGSVSRIKVTLHLQTYFRTAA